MNAHYGIAVITSNSSECEYYKQKVNYLATSFGVSVLISNLLSILILICVLRKGKIASYIISYFTRE